VIESLAETHTWGILLVGWAVLVLLGLWGGEPFAPSAPAPSEATQPAARAGRLPGGTARGTTPVARPAGPASPIGPAGSAGPTSPIGSAGPAGAPGQLAPVTQGTLGTR
jgi:hypothetical protein